jgi:hypothetical protein
MTTCQLMTAKLALCKPRHEACDAERAATGDFTRQTAFGGVKGRKTKIWRKQGGVFSPKFCFQCVDEVTPEASGILPFIFSSTICCISSFTPFAGAAQHWPAPARRLSHLCGLEQGKDKRGETDR